MNFDDFCKEISHSFVLGDIATVRKNQGLNTIHLKHKLSNESKLGQHFELQITHIFLVESSCDVMEVRKLSAQFGLRSEVVDWFREAKPVS